MAMMITSFSPLKFKCDLEKGGKTSVLKGIGNQNSNLNRLNVDRELKQ